MAKKSPPRKQPEQSRATKRKSPPTRRQVQKPKATKSNKTPAGRQPAKQKKLTEAEKARLRRLEEATAAYQEQIRGKRPDYQNDPKIKKLDKPPPPPRLKRKPREPASTEPKKVHREWERKCEEIEAANERAKERYETRTKEYQERKKAERDAAATQTEPAGEPADEGPKPNATEGDGQPPVRRSSRKTPPKEFVKPTQFSKKSPKRPAADPANGEPSPKMTAKKPSPGKQPPPAHGQESDSLEEGEIRESHTPKGSPPPGASIPTADSGTNPSTTSKGKKPSPRPVAAAGGPEDPSDDDEDDSDDPDDPNDPPPPRLPAVYDENDLREACRRRGLRTDGPLRRLRSRIAWYADHGWSECSTDSLRRLCRVRALDDIGSRDLLKSRLGLYEHKCQDFDDVEVGPRWKTDPDPDIDGGDEEDDEEIERVGKAEHAAEAAQQEVVDPMDPNHLFDDEEEDDQPLAPSTNMTATIEAGVADGSAKPALMTDDVEKAPLDSGPSNADKETVDDQTSAAVPGGDNQEANGDVEDNHNETNAMPPRGNNDLREVLALLSRGQLPVWRNDVQRFMDRYWSKQRRHINNVQGAEGQRFLHIPVKGDGDCFWRSLGGAYMKLKKPSENAARDAGRDAKSRARDMWKRVTESRGRNRAFLQRSKLYQMIRNAVDGGDTSVEKQLNEPGVYADMELLQLFADHTNTNATMLIANFGANYLETSLNLIPCFDLYLSRGRNLKRQIYIVYWQQQQHYTYLLPIDDKENDVDFVYDLHLRPENYQTRIVARAVHPEEEDAPLPHDLIRKVTANGRGKLGSVEPDGTEPKDILEGFQQIEEILENDRKYFDDKEKKSKDRKR